MFNVGRVTGSGLLLASFGIYNRKTETINVTTLRWEDRLLAFLTTHRIVAFILPFLWRTTKKKKFGIQSMPEYCGYSLV